MRIRFHVVTLVIFILGIFHFSPAHGLQPIVRAVLFTSPSYPNCHLLIETVLPALIDQYPGQLGIIGIDVTHPVGNNLYMAAVVQFNVSQDHLGVPMLLVGDRVLVGSDEIPKELSPIIQSGLAADGIDWPNIPDLDRVLSSQAVGTKYPIQAVDISDKNPDLIKKFLQDPIANTIAVIVLIGMLLSCLRVIISYLKGPESKFINAPAWVLPALAIIGIVIALYLSYIEISKQHAVCGPIGNCNSVQESPYAYLFGMIPIGALGVVGYFSILASWLFKSYGPPQTRKLFTSAIWGMAWFGVLFSIYLTFLEPFVIGATCAWCIASAVVITLIFVFSTQPVIDNMQTVIDYEDESEYEEE